MPWKIEPSDSGQKWLTRNRPPRVKITYDVEIGNAIEKIELPFVIGVMADLAGETQLPQLKERKFTDVDRDSFDKFMASVNPTLTVGTQTLPFREMLDFDPGTLVQNLDTTKDLFEKRKALRDLLTKLDGNDELAALLLDATGAHKDELTKALPSPTPTPPDNTPDPVPPAPPPTP